MNMEVIIETLNWINEVLFIYNLTQYNNVYIIFEIEISDIKLPYITLSIIKRCLKQ